MGAFIIPSPVRRHAGALPSRARLVFQGCGCVGRGGWFLRFPRLFTTGEALFLGFVMRAGFQLVVFALVAIEMEDFSSVGAAHALSFRIWRVVAKRTTLASRGND
jgi:hypothetical protein